MTTKNPRAWLCFAGLALCCAACHTVSSAQQPPVATAPSVRSTPAVIQGRVARRDATQSSDLRIAIHQVDVDGKLKALPQSTFSTDHDGFYRIELMLPQSVAVNLVVVAEHKALSGKGMAVLPSWSLVDGVMIAPTITLETAVESDIFISAAQAGLWFPHLGTNELRTLVTERLAESLRKSPEYQRDIGIMGQASVEAIEAWYRVLLDPSQGLSTEQVSAIFEAKAWAQVALDAQLFTAQSASEIEEALMMNALAVDAAYASVGIRPQHLALAAQAAADTLRYYAAEMSEGPRAMLISEAEALRAFHIINAVDALLSRTGTADKERDAVRSAGSRLEAKLTMAARVQNTDEFVRGAWSEYRVAVAGRLDAVTDSVDAPEPPKKRPTSKQVI